MWCSHDNISVLLRKDGDTRPLPHPSLSISINMYPGKAMWTQREGGHLPAREGVGLHHEPNIPAP